MRTSDEKVRISDEAERFQFQAVLYSHIRSLSGLFGVLKGRQARHLPRAPPFLGAPSRYRVTQKDVYS